MLMVMIAAAGVAWLIFGVLLRGPFGRAPLRGEGVSRGRR